MSASKHVTIWCDHDDCYAWTGGDQRRVPSARASAKQEGWTFRKGKDYCPTHSARNTPTHGGK